jgi:tRNA-splicing endonuclease subunit Sen34
MLADFANLKPVFSLGNSLLGTVHCRHLVPSTMVLQGGPEGPIQVSKIAGRYLVFDVRDIARLRRHINICSPLVGTSVQSPSQNIFLGVPAELRDEDARLLANRGLAVVQDDAAAHVALLSGQEGSAAKDEYKVWLRTRRLVLNAVYVQGREQRNTEIHKEGKKKPRTTVPSTPSTQPQRPATVLSCAVNPAANPQDYPGGQKFAAPLGPSHDGHGHGRGALHSYLQSQGYYMMPGIRFGCQYSAYPGDPFRYHAHFLANEYGWDDEIPLMDLVGNGRLATSVKKGFVLGARDPEGSMGGEGHPESCQGSVRTFAVEWAGM